VKDFSPLNITDASVGFPARLLVITLSNGTVYRFAESDESINVGADTFGVLAGLNISAIRHTGNGEMPSCQIDGVHSRGGTIATFDLDAGLFDAAVIQIYVVDRLNLTRKGLLFTGAVADITYTVENLFTFQVKGAAVSAKILMTETRSPMCRTDLYSVLCQVNAASYAVSTTVASIVNQFNFTVSGLAQADGYFNQGVILTSTGNRFEIGNWVNSTQTITSYSPSNLLLVVGESLTLYPGCDKTVDGSNGCPKFSNNLNFQGEPHFLGTANAAQQV
jgi:uncharacterized phage protein (TIGR02218 family)